MTRIVSAAFREAVDASANGELFLTFLTITHPRLSKAVRVVSELVDYRKGGNHFIGCLFTAKLLTDNEDFPRAALAINNASRDIGESIKELSDSPRMVMEVYLQSHFTDDVDPALKARLEIGEATPEYVARGLRLSKVSADAMQVTADITTYDYSSEPWPYLRGTKNRLPGLYW